MLIRTPPPAVWSSKGGPSVHHRHGQERWRYWLTAASATAHHCAIKHGAVQKFLLPLFISEPEAAAPAQVQHLLLPLLGVLYVWASDSLLSALESSTETFTQFLKKNKKPTISCAAALKTKYLTFVCLCTPAAGTSSSTCVYYNYYYTNFTNTGPVFYLLSFNNNLKYNRSTSIRYMNITLRYCSVSLKQHGCWVDVLKYYISEVQMWGSFIYVF